MKSCFQDIACSVCFLLHYHNHAIKGSMLMQHAGIIKSPATAAGKTICTFFMGISLCGRKSSKEVPKCSPLPRTERLLLRAMCNTGILASRGEEFDSGPEMRLDHFKPLCNKFLLKFKRDNESFWHRYQRKEKECPLASFYVLRLFSSVQSLSYVRLCATPWIVAVQASLSITTSWSSLRLTSIESVIPSSYLSLCCSLLLLPPIPPSITALESFPMSQHFTWGGQSTGVSALASFLLKNTQGWSPSEWTGWISLQSKGLTIVFSNTTVQKHQFFCAQLSSQRQNWNFFFVDYFFAPSLCCGT